MRMTRPIVALALCALLLISAAPALAADAFSAADLIVNSVAAGAGPDEVRSALGDPSATETSEEAATGDTLETWTYEGLTLTFRGGALAAAEWTSPELIGPRGLRIGDSLDTVKNAFRVDPDQTDPAVLYSAGKVEATGVQLPPCGTVSEATGGETAVTYLAPVEPYPAAVLADPASYVFERHAALTLTLSADSQTVERIRWSLGALAE